MLCPYCNTEYTHDYPCFCHPALHTAPADEQGPSPTEDFSHSNVSWNAHRGVRLD